MGLRKVTRVVHLAFKTSWGTKQRVKGDWLPKPPVGQVPLVNLDNSVEVLDPGEAQSNRSN